MQSAAPNGRSHERSGPGQARRGLRLGERAAFRQVAGLRGKAFPNLGSSAFAGLAVRVASQVPWSVLRGVYPRIGASGCIDPSRAPKRLITFTCETPVDRVSAGRTHPVGGN